jgi:LmbE family N-acetylglucosaminyl deacetylase
VAVVTEIKPAEGTDERLWSAWEAPARWPRLDPSDLAGRRVVVVAAHPDDEVLGVGGLVRRLVAARAELSFVWATDGEASHPGSTTVRARDLAAARRDESAAALAALGAGVAPRLHLGLPDGGLVDREPALARLLRGPVEGADLVLAPWSRDGHPDHEACGHAATTVATHVLEYPVWMWHWAVPGDHRVPWSRACRVDLDREVRGSKAAAVGCFASQIRPLGPGPQDAPVLPPRVLAHFARDHEVLLR